MPYIINVIKTSVLSCIIIFTLSGLKAQPGDFGFSILLFDNHESVNCKVSQNNYQLYSAKSDYKITTDNKFGLLYRKPILNSISKFSMLKCEETSKNDKLNLPYHSYFSYSSCNNTDLLIIIRNHLDTMIIDNFGGYSFYLSHLTYPSGVFYYIPYTILFRKGLFRTDELDKDSARLNFQLFLYHQFISENSKIYYQKESNQSNTEKTNTSSFNINENNKYKTFQSDSVLIIQLSKNSFFEDDTLFASVTGNVMLDGSCSNKQLFWHLQKKSDTGWKTIFNYCCNQMDCGKPYSQSKNTDFIISKINSKIPGEIPSHNLFTSGMYRIGLYRINNSISWSDSFVVNID